MVWGLSNKPETNTSSDFLRETLQKHIDEQVQPTGHENIGAGIVVLLVFCTITPCTIVCHLVCLCCAWCAAPRERELVSDKKSVSDESATLSCLVESLFTMGEYGASLEELRALMEYRGAEAKEKIDADYGGITGLCERLKTDPNNGIPNTTTELERRRAVFGANEIPPHPPKCFLQLVWEALQLLRKYPEERFPFVPT
ncbi:cation transporter/ATPase [Ancylostoma ceylanicum]|uniref:Cation transporter/ATPase n=1 Tax=Ancylostoma ceylanicum TaxID=53326 RepID=A0A0D6LYH6_9BILA|nr:cation transporter/ATPase [Ancylostoma ceylanicum]